MKSPIAKWHAAGKRVMRRIDGEFVEGVLVEGT